MESNRMAPPLVRYLMRIDLFKEAMEIIHAESVSGRGIKKRREGKEYQLRPRLSEVQSSLLGDGQTLEGNAAEVVGVKRHCQLGFAQSFLHQCGSVKGSADIGAVHFVTGAAPFVHLQTPGVGDAGIICVGKHFSSKAQISELHVLL